MRQTCFWFGAAVAALANVMNPVWAYWVIFGIAIQQVVTLSAGKNSIFLLVHYVTILLYFSLAPAMQISTNTMFWGAGALGSPAHHQAFLLLLTYLCGVELAGAIRFNYRSTPPPANSGTSERPAAPLPMASLVFILISTVAATGLLFVKPDLNFMARGIVPELTTRPLDLMFFSTLPKTFVLLAFAVVAINLRQNKTITGMLVALLAMGLACVAGNPVTTARQLMLIGLMPIGLHYLMQRRKMIFALLTFAAVAGIGPFFNFISRSAFYDVDLDSYPLSPDFDAMYIVAGLIERTATPDAGLGRYLVSAMSFVLPRQLKLFPDFDPLLWASVGANFSQANLSLPPFVPAFFDFGYVGPLLLGLGVGKLFQHLESGINFMAPMHWRHLLALVALASYVPFLRGPILGWGPFAASGVISIAFLAWIARRSPVIQKTVPPSFALFSTGKGKP